MEKIRNIQEKCEGNTSEETLNDRKDQLAYAKIITAIALPERPFDFFL